MTRHMGRAIFAAVLSMAAALEGRAGDVIRFAVPEGLPATGMAFSNRMDAAAGDLDGDGLPEVCVGALSGIDTYSASSSRRFGPRVRVASALGDDLLRPVGVADVDGNGRADVIVAARQSLGVLFGGADLEFTDGPSTPIGALIEAIASGHLNGDAIPDVVVVTQSGGERRIAAWLGDGGGGGEFLLADEVVLGTDRRWSLRLFDVDGDGALDALACNAELFRIHLLRGDGAGQFLDPVLVATPGDPVDVAVFDFDGDGVEDLAVANGTAARIDILAGTGFGQYFPALSIETVSPPWAVHVADVDGDGSADVIGPTSGPSLDPDVNDTTLRVHLGDGALGFSLVEPRAELPRTPTLGSLLVDVDSDGAVDYVGAGRGIGSGGTYAYALFSSGDGRFGESPRYVQAGKSPRAIRVADFDADGFLDAAVLDTSSTSSAVGVFLGDGNGSLSPRGTFAVASGLTMTVGDFDLDGDVDVAVGARFSADVHLLLNDGTGGFSAGVTAFVEHVPDALESFDANEDGRLDLVALSREKVVRVLQRADGTFGAPGNVLERRDMRDIGVADMDLDGHVDVVCVRSLLVSVKYGDGAGGFARGLEVVGPLVGDGSGLSIGDLDSDGLDDLVLSGSVVPGLGVAGFGVPLSLASSLDPLTTSLGRAGLADFDGDGAMDLFLGTPPTALRGDGAFGFADASVSAISPFAYAVADFDRDCHPDVAVVEARGVTVLANRSFDSFAVRAGNVNAAAGPVTDVLFVNGSPGIGPERHIRLGTADSLEIFMASPPSSAGAKFALYKWLSPPTGGTVQVLPFGLGRIAMPTPLTPLCHPRPKHIWNNIGKFARLGVPTHTSTRSPSVVQSTPGGLGHPRLWYLQGFILDDAAPNGRAAVTNGILLEVGD